MILCDLYLPKILQDIWILTEQGFVLFNHTYDEKLKNTMFGAIMSALNSFANELDQGALSNFQLSKKRFSIFKKNKLIFITNSNPKKVNEKKVLKELEVIANKFFELYGNFLIEDLKEDTRIFADFINKIDESVEEKVQGFLDNI